MEEIITIDIEQTLHGYNEGHRLLATSTEIGKEAQRSMLVLSDMSGPSMQYGFEEYLTGYPLTNLELYAFSKTWFAPEMSRPGCVWTHTLILSTEALRLISDLQSLLLLFKHPKSPSDFPDYTEKIKYQQSPPSKILSKMECHYLAPSILSGLYGYERDYPVALASEQPLTLQDTIMAIWSQQWPALRQRFTFCSGAMSVRLVNGNPFDFQIIPISQRRQFEREVKDIRFVDNKLNMENQKEWIDDLIKDITDDTKTPLREFFTSFGGNARYQLSKLTSFYHKHCYLPVNSTVPRGLIELFYNLFPNANESAPELVRSIFGRRLGQKESELLGVSEYEMLLGLATYDGNFDLEPLQVDANGRALQLFIENKLQAIVLMSHITENRITPIGREMMNGFASVISTEDLIDISNSNADLLFALTSVTPMLAATPSLWRQIKHSEQLTLLEAISLDKLSKAETHVLITAIIEAGASSISDEVFQKFGRQAVESVLGFIDKNGHLPGDTIEWSSLLRRQPGITVDWLKSNFLNDASTLAFIVTGLEPSGEIVTAENVQLWARLLRQFENDFDRRDALAVSYFLMPIALKNSGRDANYLATFSFPYVHDALSKDTFDWRIWKILEPLLPELPWHWFRSWDKCERLRMAMNKRGLQDIVERNIIRHARV